MTESALVKHLVEPSGFVLMSHLNLLCWVTHLALLGLVWVGCLVLVLVLICACSDLVQVKIICCASSYHDCETVQCSLGFRVTAEAGTGMVSSGSAQMKHLEFY